MLILGLNSGHDGAFAAIEDGKLLFSLETEKDSWARYSPINATAVLTAVERLGEFPDVVAHAGEWTSRWRPAGAGYLGAARVEQRPMRFLGREVTLVSTTHERSHIVTSISLAGRDNAPLRAALVWEGLLGKLYLVDSRATVVREIEVRDAPGSRWAALFALANPHHPDRGYPRDADAGKLMALAAFGDPEDADAESAAVVDRLMTLPSTEIWPIHKDEFQGTPIHNAGVVAQVTKDAAALLTRRLFDLFSKAALEHLPPGLPLHISGGCGLNCDWNRMWRELGHFSSVFVPPCPNDSGQAIGAAAEAHLLMTGDPCIDWDVYAGLDFEWDRDPRGDVWAPRPVDYRAVAEAVAEGRIFAWAQGRAELGPRALGNRSLLADPSDARTRERLNDIKQREDYRPIAPCCRVEDLDKVFDTDFEDPYMLYFRRATSGRIAAATHVDGTARCQTVTRKSNRRLHDLLCAVAERSGVGALCNTSLNWPGLGFINKLSDMAEYCYERDVDDMVVNDTWFQRIEPLRRDG